MLKTKSFFCGLLTLLIIFSSFESIHADEIYKVLDIVDNKYQEIDTFEDLTEAKKFYDQHIDDYDNLTLMDDLRVIDTKYGVISFLDDDIVYTSLRNGETNISNSYTSEACYLYWKDGKVYFKLSGDIGYIDEDKVQITPYDLLENEVSVYLTDNNYLRHEIKTNLEYAYYNYDLKLDKIPNGLNSNTKYYSYDNHYFYEDFKIMVNDYLNNTYENAVNYDNPYYNYYEFLPHRSYTKYTFEEIENYFLNDLCIDGKLNRYNDFNNDGANDEVNLSQMYDELDAFFSYEAIYGANAMMLLTSAINESSYGKNENSFINNNLYSTAAFDSEEERTSERYSAISNSIYAHAKYYVSKLAGSVYSKNYSGTFFGDKATGMNASYSKDPFWGEKNSGLYFSLDEYLGFKDLNNYALGIVDNQKLVSIYHNENLEDLYYELKNVEDYSLILLEELEDVYKIQVDYSGGESYKYNPQNSVGYISKDLIDYILNEEQIRESEYQEVYFDFNGGKLVNEYSLSLVLPSDKNVKMIEPIYDDYEFVKYDDAGLAEYKKINEIRVNSDANISILANGNFDLREGTLQVTYEDGSSTTLDLDSNMIKGIDTNAEAELVLEIEYCGVKTEHKVDVENSNEDIEESIENIVTSNINSYLENGEYNQEELTYLKDNLSKTNYKLSMNELRLIDAMLLASSRDALNYNYKGNLRDISISGLALSLNDPKKLSILKPFKDTYYILIEDNENYDPRIDSMAKAYGFEIEDSFNITVDYNLQDADIKNPVVINIKINDKDVNKIYTVYHLDDSGNIIKCACEHSTNYLSFMTSSLGDFVVLKKDSVNTFDFVDIQENINLNNSDPDNHLLFIEGGIIALVGILGFMMIVIYYILNKKEEKIWNDYKKYLLEAESVHVEKLKN